MTPRDSKNDNSSGRMNIDVEKDDDESLDDRGSIDSDFMSEDEDEDDLDDAFGSFLMAAVHSQGEELMANQQAMATALGAPVSHMQGPSPEDLWGIFLSEVSTGERKVLKISAACFVKYGLGDGTDFTADIVNAIASSPGLTHVVLEDNLLRSIQQPILFQAISRHFKSLTYIKLVPNESTLNIPATLSLLANVPMLSELELHKIDLELQQVEQLSEIFNRSALRQINVFGLSVTKAETKSLDSIIRSLSTLQPLDELRLEGRNGAFVSAEALSELLLHKQKWWRLGLDNLGLTDKHCHVIASMFARNDTCKVGDLLSLLSNPAITSAGYKNMFGVFYNKGRMGLIKVDDKSWETEFDLVRSMNNLHGRLDVVKDSEIISRTKWTDWISQLGTRGWEHDSKKLTYVWFALKQNPEVFKSSSE